MICANRAIRCWSGVSALLLGRIDSAIAAELGPDPVATT
jgi:hypothetical protein